MLRAGAAALCLLLAVSASAGADTYTVTRTDDPSPDVCLPGDCSLREAVEASNASTAVDDRILLPASPAPYGGNKEFGSVQEPFDLTDSVEVVGEGADRVTVEGTGQNVVLSIPAVDPAPVVLLEGLTIAGGRSGIENHGNLTLRRVGVERNQPDGGIQSSGPLTLDSSFVGFNESFSAPAIFATAPTTVVNSTIAWNAAGGVGAIGGNMSIAITSSAVVFNHSSGDTEAAVAAVPLTVRDSVFAGNANAKGPRNCFSVPAVNSLGGNVGDDASCGTAAGDKPNTNPRVDTLGFYGGTTPVYDLDPASPAIDAATQCLPFDQRNLARPQGAACDSGPYELVPAPPVPVVDREFSMRVGKKLRLGKNAIWVRLTCPASEVSPPCRGRAGALHLPLGIKGPHTMETRPIYGRFSIQPGKTKAVPLRKPFARVRRLPETPGKWRVSFTVTARDGAGNAWSYFKKGRMPLIRR
ncbi:MAG: CSLREA domain-containing protein [Actinomycetota bacterium]|nr:CSLREA domain-containing protein [Actinomycetota bacterium]